ncbi:MAG TPA: hypothetical protein VK861_01690 [Bacteroidales bacterium]|nr:hypothetical protein [Bacteroidales bacterium]
MEIIYCCSEDYDMGIDDFILKYETFPIIEKDEEHLCAYCSEISSYRLTLPQKVEHAD